MTAPASYSRLQIALHWLIALLIVAAWFTDDGMGRALHNRLESGATGFSGNTLHVWLGSAVFVLVLIRVLVRFGQGAPVPVDGPRLAQRLALWGHRLLYLLMIAVPALGASAWYLGIEAAGEPHELTANLLMIVALGHALVAIWHQLFRRDGTLTRMIRPGA